MKASRSQTLSKGRTSAKATSGNTNQISADSATMPMIEAARMHQPLLHGTGPRQENVDPAVGARPSGVLLRGDGLSGPRPEMSRRSGSASLGAISAATASARCSDRSWLDLKRTLDLSGVLSVWPTIEMSFGSLSRVCGDALQHSVERFFDRRPARHRRARR